MIGNIVLFHKLSISSKMQLCVCRNVNIMGSSNINSSSRDLCIIILSASLPQKPFRPTFPREDRIARYFEYHQSSSPSFFLFLSIPLQITSFQLATNCTSVSDSKAPGFCKFSNPIFSVLFIDSFPKFKEYDSFFYCQSDFLLIQVSQYT